VISGTFTDAGVPPYSKCSCNRIDLTSEIEPRRARPEQQEGDAEILAAMLEPPEPWEQARPELATIAA
jgi:hypothetical protein